MGFFFFFFFFFFGYDQGAMGGVNTARDYAEIMGFGHWGNTLGRVLIDKPTLQGGIVSPLQLKEPIQF